MLLNTTKYPKNETIKKISDYLGITVYDLTEEETETKTTRFDTQERLKNGDFYDSFIKFCNVKGVSPTSVFTAIGLSKSIYTNMKSGGEPTIPTKRKIAEYFNVTVEQLNNGDVLALKENKQVVVNK